MIKRSLRGSSASALPYKGGRQPILRTTLLDLRNAEFACDDDYLARATTVDAFFIRASVQ